MAGRTPSTLLRLVARPARAVPDIPDREPGAAPHPPTDFDEAHAACWRDTAALLVGNGSWHPEAAPTLRLYCIASCEAVAARADVLARGLFLRAPKPGDDEVGTTGDGAINPFRQVAREAEATAERLARTLGLVPGARRA